MLEKDWIFSVDNYFCDIRTVGVLVKNHKILVQRDRNGNEYALPGGHIKIGETLQSGLIREYKEETGIDIRIKQIFYFLIEECDGFEIPDTGEFVSHKDNCNVVIGWMDIDQIENVVIYPEFLKKEIHDLNGLIKHFVSK